MKIKTKIAIFLTAVLLSFLEFNIIASCSQCVDLLKVGKRAGYEIIANIITEETNIVANSAD